MLSGQIEEEDIAELEALIRSEGERAPYSFGLKEPNACSRCNRLSRSLWSERHNTEESPSIHPRVDQGTTRREL